MTFDGLFTRAMVYELNENILNGRIGKIYQPANHEILLNIRAFKKNLKLLLSIHPNHCRVQLTNNVIDNPTQAPMFCMLLRKHLEGSVIDKIYQPHLERIIIFSLRCRNELGDIYNKQLIIEIMGRHSNLFLVDEKSQLIIDCLKHVSLMQNRVRKLYSGQIYEAPPAQNKLNPLEVDETILKEEKSFHNPKKFLVEKYLGLSPFIAEQFKSYESFNSFLSLVKKHDYKPTIGTKLGRESYYFCEFLADELKGFFSLSQMLDSFYFGKTERERIRQQTDSLEKHLTSELVRNKNKLPKLFKQLDETANADVYRKSGELILANLHLIKKGMKKIVVQDFYSESGKTLEILLDEWKTPNQNATKYFSKYQKIKASISHLNEQIAATNAEILYLESILQQLETASTADLDEIFDELVLGKYLRSKNKLKKNKLKKTKQKPFLEKYVSSDGAEILVGKNNLQNEYLTMKLASKNHMWFHVKDISGSHVVILSDAPSDVAISEAAQIAAYFSKARDSGNVAVDYTKIRHVKKPAGAKPGYVIYDNQKTIYVTADKDLVLTLKK